MNDQFSTLKKVLAVIAFLCLSNTHILAQREIDATFKNGLQTKIIFEDENPDNIINWNLSLRFLGLRLFRNVKQEIGGMDVAGPIFLDLDFQQFLFNKKGMINLRTSFTYIDSRFLDVLPGLRKPFFFYEAIYTHEFKSFDFIKKKMKLNFTDGDIYSFGNKRMIRVYRIKTPVTHKRSLGIRTGFHYYQFSLKNTEYDEVVRDINFGNTSSIFIGLASNRLLNLKYSSSAFGSQKLFGMWTLYSDLLFAVNSNIFTGRYGSNNENIINQVNTSDFDQRPIGFRIGGYRKVSMARSNLATIYSFEFGSLPGVIRELYFTIGIGIVLGPFKKH